MAFAFAACGGGSDNDDGPLPDDPSVADPNSPVDPNPPRDSLLEWMQNGTFYYEYVIHSESSNSPAMDGTGYFAKDGVKCATRMESSFEGENNISGSITVENWTYAILYDMQQYMKMPGNAAGCTDTGSAYVSVKIDEGIDTIAAGTQYARQLPFERYSTLGENGWSRMFFDGNSVYGFDYSSVRNIDDTWMARE
jgi:hypothetical protein